MENKISLDKTPENPRTITFIFLKVICIIGVALFGSGAMCKETSIKSMTL
jgi:hypothetical protein